MTRSVPSPALPAVPAVCCISTPAGLPAPLQDVRRTAGAEMPDVDALGAADPDPARPAAGARGRTARTAAGSPRSRPAAPRCPVPSAGQRCRTAARARRRDVRAEHVDLADRLDLGGVLLVVELVRGPVGGVQATADEPERAAVQLAPARRPAPAGPAARGQPTAAAGRRCRKSGKPVGHGREQLRVLAPRRPPRCARGDRRRARPTAPPTSSGPRRTAAPSAARPTRRARSAPNRSAKDALAMVRVVDEQQQVTEADQRVRAVPRGS